MMLEPTSFCLKFKSGQQYRCRADTPYTAIKQARPEQMPTQMYYWDGGWVEVRWLGIFNAWREYKGSIAPLIELAVEPKK